MFYNVRPHHPEVEVCVNEEFGNVLQMLYIIYDRE